MANLKNINITSGSGNSNGVIPDSQIMGRWELDPIDGTSVQFRVPSSSFGGDNDRIAFYVSSSGKIGIGTKNPESAFDVRDVGEDRRDLEGDDSDNRRTNLLKLDRTSSRIAIKATQFQTARTIGGVSFNGTANINLPGVNTAGNQATSGLAATATKLAATKTIGGVAFDGSANINLPGVNAGGNQATSGLAATATLAADATTLATPRAIGGVNFDGSAAIIPKSHMGSITKINITPGDFNPISAENTGVLLQPHRGGSTFISTAAGTFVANIQIPVGLSPTHVQVFGSQTRCIVKVYIATYLDTTSTQIDNTGRGIGFAVGTNTAVTATSAWRADRYYLVVTVTTTGTDQIYGGHITVA